MDLKCPFCAKPVLPTDRFCSTCGEVLKKDVPLSLGQKTKIYLISFILAPFGLYWFFKYRKSEDKDKRKVSRNVLYISLIMLIIFIVINVLFVQVVMKYLDMYMQSLGLEGITY